MAIHTFGEYLDFHSHLHALVADGLFVRSGLFYPAPAGPKVSLKALEELFRARVITFLMDKGLLPVERANMLRGWVHSGFNVHRSRRVLPDEREDLERLAQYIIRNPFAVEKMQVSPPNQANPDGLIIYRSELNPKCRKEMRIVALIDDRDVIERILRHLGLWEQGVRVSPARAPPEIAEWVIPPSPVGYGGRAEPCCDDPFPDYDTEPVMMYANA